MVRRRFRKSKQGFTIIEVMLVLAVTGLMLIGVLGSTYVSINSQRYNDSIRNFAEYMRSIYAEALSPASITEDEDAAIGNSSDYAILGKIVVFGVNDSDTVYSATLVGTTNKNLPDEDFLTSITDIDSDGTNTSVFCGNPTAGQPSSVQSYTPLWEAKLAQANNMPSGAHYPNQFKGTMIIARTPTSSTIHTAFAPDKVYDFSGDNCTAANAAFRNDLSTQHSGFDTFFEMNEPTGICVTYDSIRVHREVRIAADGRNASAVWLRETDPEDGATHAKTNLQNQTR